MAIQQDMPAVGTQSSAKLGTEDVRAPVLRPRA